MDGYCPLFVNGNAILWHLESVVTGCLIIDRGSSGSTGLDDDDEGYYVERPLQV